MPLAFALHPAKTRRLFLKVPFVTLGFWIAKILTTTVGETGADYLAVHAGLGIAWTDALTAAALVLALAAQLRARRHVPWLYWSTVVLVSIAGTQITDCLTDQLGISLYASTAAFAATLAVLFAVWHRVEGTLSIREIHRGRREAFYWAAVLVTFALGTAGGDLAAEAVGLGYRVGIAVFLGLIALVLIAWRLGVDATAAFWVAYILTRPLGACVGDFLSQSRDYGGLGLETVTTSAVFLICIVLLVASFTWTARSAWRAAQR